jgi:hypothetical protein
LYGLRIANKFEKDMVDFLDEMSDGATDTKTRLGHGLEIKIAVRLKKFDFCGSIKSFQIYAVLDAVTRGKKMSQI